MKIPWLTLIAAALVVALACAPGAPAWLELDRAHLWSAEVWRVFTAHLVHWNAEHAAWNVASWLSIGALLENRSRPLFACTVLAAMIAISGGLLACDPQLARFRGLSGINHALATAAMILLLRRAWTLRSARACVLLATGLIALVGKLAAEWEMGRSLVVSQDFVLVPLSHILGALTGATISLPLVLDGVRRILAEVQRG